MKPRRFFSYEWDAIAGIVAAVAAIVLHLLHVVDERVILPIVLALMGLLFINFIRHSRHNEQTAVQVARTELAVDRISDALRPPDVVLVGPRELRSASERFYRDMGGDVVFYNVCLSMYRTPALFDRLLRPALENARVDSVRFVLDRSQRPLWQQAVLPLIEDSGHAAKVDEPVWHDLERTVSFILADNQRGGLEALLSFWGEPFMAQSTAQELPRYMFHVLSHSPLLSQLVELERAQRLTGESP